MKVRAFKTDIKALYHLCIIIWIICSVFFGRTTFVNNYIWSLKVYSYGRYICYAILIAMIMSGHYDKTKLCIVSFVGLSTVISVIQSSEMVIVSLLLFFVASRYGEAQKIVRIYLWIHIGIVMITFLFTKLDLIQENIVNRGPIIRYSYGFLHPNGFGGEILLIVLCWFYLNWDKIRFVDFLISTLMIIWMYLVSNCRADAILGMMFLILTAWTTLDKKKNVRKMVHFIANMIITLTVTASLCMMLGIGKDKEIWKILDAKLSFRPAWSYQTFERYGVSILGQDIYLEMIDNSYIRILLLNGAVFSLIFVFCLFTCAYVFYKKNDMIGEVILIILVLLGFMENNLFRIESNFIILIFGNYVLRPDKIKSRMIHK